MCPLEMAFEKDITEREPGTVTARDCGKETAEESAAVRGHRLYK